MTDNDTVERLAGVLHANDCPDDECDGGDMGNYDWLAQALLPTVRELQAEVLEKAADDCRDVFLMRTTAPTSWTTNAADAIEQILRAEAATYRSPQATTGGANND